MLCKKKDLAKCLQNVMQIVAKIFCAAGLSMFLYSCAHIHMHKRICMNML